MDDPSARMVPSHESRIHLDGTVVRTVYHDPSSRWTVLRVEVPGRFDAVTAVGRSSGVDDGAAVRFEGEWSHHPTHGPQFAFSSLSVAHPATPEQMERRLHRYPGIREVMAERIVQRFGSDTLSILESDPRRLLEVEGIGPKTLSRIVDYHRSRVGPAAAIENRLIELDVSHRFADAILRRFGEQAMAIIETRPYLLAREVRGIGFATADRLARALGVDLESDERVEAGVLHVLQQAEGDGHCALPSFRLLQTGVRLLGLDEARVRAGIDRLAQQGDLIEEGTEEAALCFLREHVFAEQTVAEVWVHLALVEKPRWVVEGLPPDLSGGQVAAVEAIAQNGVVILTGGPGTGKSTVVRHVIELALRHDVEVRLAAPTGRAAKRLEQATGHSASTVHRLLEVQGESGAFTYNANQPLPPGLLVIDEASMLDLALAEALLCALTSEHRVMLVGDADQLPSVGPGNVLRDLVSACDNADSPIPVVRLTEVFRQAAGSSIVVNAHRILHGQALLPDVAEGGQFYVVRASDGERAQELMVRMAVERMPVAYGLDPRTDVQVLCPMHRGAAGTEALNTILQQRYTGDAPGLVLPGIAGQPDRVFRIGDRVMQTRNDYLRGVFNGDIGTVVEVGEHDRSASVEFEGELVRYEGRDFTALRLAYAVSIHKSQGSEFPAVIVPILGEHHVMLRRNLVYTAITRARDLCVIVGDPRAIETAIRKADAAQRHTGLRARVLEQLGSTLGSLTFVPD